MCTFRKTKKTKNKTHFIHRCLFFKTNQAFPPLFFDILDSSSNVSPPDVSNEMRFRPKDEDNALTVGTVAVRPRLTRLGANIIWLWLRLVASGT